MLGKHHGRDQKVLMFDTFSGSPTGTRRDSLRGKREYVLPADYLRQLHRQAAALQVEDRVEIHQGEFRGAFERAAHSPRRFACAHIDANLYQSTLDACSFVIPRLAAGGAIVFDDYHGPCDLGARLVIDQYCAGRGFRPRRLAGSSAYLTINASYETLHATVVETV